MSACADGGAAPGPGSDPRNWRDLVRRHLSRVFVHLVWATWNRRRIITPIVRPRLYRCLHSECSRLGAQLVAVGGIKDHVHLLVRLPSTVCVSAAVKQLKGSSSHFVNHEVLEAPRFRWQGSYGAFSVSERALPRVRDYILRQEDHHRAGKVYRVFERCDHSA